MAPTIDVDVQVPDDQRDPAGGTLYCRIEDITEADAIAGVLAEQTLDVSNVPYGESLHLEIEVPEENIQAKASYSVRLHLDKSGNGRVSSGDYVTTQSYPVLTHGAPRRISANLKRVT